MSGSHEKKVPSDILAVTEVGSKCPNAAKKSMKKKIQEVAASLAGAKEISMDAAVVALSLKKTTKKGH